MPEILEALIDPASFVCPTPIGVLDRIVLGHGSGGRLSANLLRDVFLPVFSNPVLDRLDDQAVLDIGGAQLALQPILSWSSRCFSPAAISVRWPCTAPLTISPWGAPRRSI